MKFAQMLLSTPATTKRTKAAQQRAIKLADYLGDKAKSTNEMIEELQMTHAAVAGAIHSALRSGLIKEVGSWPTGRFGNRVKVWKCTPR